MCGNIENMWQHNISVNKTGLYDDLCYNICRITDLELMTKNTLEYYGV